METCWGAALLSLLVHPCVVHALTQPDAFAPLRTLPLHQARDNDRTKANIRPELQPALRLGRPDLPQLFMDTARRAESLREREVAVFVCG